VSDSDQENVNEGVTLDVALNGQQEQLVQRLVASDPYGRDIEALIRQGLSEFAKQHRRCRVPRGRNG